MKKEIKQIENVKICFFILHLFGSAKFMLNLQLVVITFLKNEPKLSYCQYS